MTTSHHTPQPSDDSRNERLRALAVTARHDPAHVTARWLADQLEEIGASLDDFDEAVVDYTNEPEPDAPDVDVLDDYKDDIDFAAMVRRAWKAEVQAAARTNSWLTQAAIRDPEFDWDAVAKLLGTSPDVLRLRAGAEVGGKMPRVGVSREGLPPAAAAAALGIGRSTLYRWIDEGKVTQITVNGRPRIMVDGNGNPLVRRVPKD